MVLHSQASENWLRNAVLRRGCFMARSSVNDLSWLPVEESAFLAFVRSRVSLRKSAASSPVLPASRLTSKFGLRHQPSVLSPFCVRHLLPNQIHEEVACFRSQLFLVLVCWLPNVWPLEPARLGSISLFLQRVTSICGPCGS